MRPAAAVPGRSVAAGHPARLLEGGLRVLLGLVLLAVTAVNVANALGRYLFGAQIAGTDELLAYAMVWVVMLGLPLITAQRRNLALDMIGGFAAGWAATARDAFVHLLMAATCLYAAWQSWQFIVRLTQIGSRSMGLGLPMAAPHAALLVGFALTALVASGLLAADLRRLAGPAERRP